MRFARGGCRCVVCNGVVWCSTCVVWCRLLWHVLCGVKFIGGLQIRQCSWCVKIVSGLCGLTMTVRWRFCHGGESVNQEFVVSNEVATVAMSGREQM